MRKNTRAYTLMELLVVIAIIGLLIVIAVISLNNVRAKARDARRVADIKKIQTSLELFYNDAQRYPTTTEFVIGAPLQFFDGYGTNTYLKAIPAAPTPADGGCLDSDNTYTYHATTGATYTLSSCLGGPVGNLVAGRICATPDATINGVCP